MLTKVGWETIESLSSVCGQTTVGDYFFSDQKWEVMKWLPLGITEEEWKKLSLPTGCRVALDRYRQAVVLFPNPWSIEYFHQVNKGVTLLNTPLIGKNSMQNQEDDIYASRR